MERKGGLFTVLFVLVFVIVLGLFVFGIILFVGKGVGFFYKNVELSPLGEDVEVLDNDRCEDSDGGIFLGEKGVVNYVQGFLFFDFDREVEDKCDGVELHEYYCSLDGVVEGVVECEGVCFDGSCLG